MKTFLMFKQKIKKKFYDHMHIWKYPKTGMVKVLKTGKVFSSILARRLIFNTVLSESPLLCPRKHVTLLVPCPIHESVELSISYQPWEIFLKMAKVQDGRSKPMSNSKKKKKSARFGWLLIKYTFPHLLFLIVYSRYLKLNGLALHWDSC